MIDLMNFEYKNKYKARLYFEKMRWMIKVEGLDSSPQTLVYTKQEPALDMFTQICSYLRNKHYKTTWEGLQ